MATGKLVTGAVNDIFATTEDAAGLISVLANDLPAPVAKTLVSLSGAKSAMGASISISAGKVNYDPAVSLAIQALAAGETATDTFTYTMKEPGNRLFTATVTVTLAGLNDPPKILGTGSSQTTDTATINPFANASVVDVDHGAQETLTITTKDKDGNPTDAHGLLSGAGLTKTGVGTYTLVKGSPSATTFALDNLVFTPTSREEAASQVVKTTFGVTAVDDQGASSGTDSNTVVSVTQTTAPAPSQLVGYAQTLITVPNTGTINSSLARDISDSGEIVGQYSQTVSGTTGTTFGFTIINGVLNTVMVPGATHTEIDQVANNGDYAGVYGSTPTEFKPFVFHNGAYNTIPTGTTNDFIDGMNEVNQVLVKNANNDHFIYDDDTGSMSPVTGLDDSSNITLTDINDDGFVTGQSPSFFDPGDRLGFIYDSKGTSKFGTGFGTNTIFTGINDKGDVIGSYIDGTTRHGFLALGAVERNPGGGISIDFVTNRIDLGPMTIPEEINNNDFVVGSDTSGNMFAYAGTLTKNTALNVTPNNSTGGYTAINDQNISAGELIIGGKLTANYGTPIFV